MTHIIMLYMDVSLRVPHTHTDGVCLVSVTRESLACQSHSGFILSQFVFLKSLLSIV